MHMKMNKALKQALYNPKAHTALLQEIEYDCNMMALVLDMNSLEIPNKSLFGAAQHTQDLFHLIVFCCQMFEAMDIGNDLYLIQKQYIMPGDLLARARLSTGYMLLALFPRQDFEEHFPLVCRTVIALNNGHLTLDEALATDMDFDSLATRIQDINASMGTYKCTKAKRRKHENIVGSFMTSHDFDGNIEKYHHYLLPGLNEDDAWTTTLVHDMAGADLNEAWLYRANLLTPDYLFNTSCRLTSIYKNLLQLAELVQPGHFTKYSPKLRNLQSISVKLTERDVVVDLFRQYLKMFDWAKMLREDQSGKWKLNLQDMVAWKVEPSHKIELGFFYDHTFYTLYSQGHCRNAPEKLEEVAPHANIDDYTKRIWLESVSQLYNADATMHGVADASMKNRFSCLYPVMSDLKILYSNYAQVLKMNNQVCECYRNTHFGRFFLSVYEDAMKSNTFVMSEARKVQYKRLPKLLSIFKNGCLNGMRDGDAGEFLQFSTCKICNVEPTQDIMANQLLFMANLCGICHLSTEFFLCLFSNILSFTTREEKPFIVLDGPTGAGKSYMAHCNQAIVVGSGETQNNYACIDEHYATTRSHTVSQENPFCSVLGQRLIEEWQSSSGGNNPYMDNVSLESVTMKNAFDHGMSCSQRCKTIKDKNKGERIVRSVEFALTDRSTIILANGFQVCSSVEERCMVYHIPDLTANVAMVSQNKLAMVLDHYKVPQFFSLMRYHISEQYNRDALGMSMKFIDHEDALDRREIDLTFFRMEEVIKDMGLSSNSIFTHRKKIQIVKFAELIAHWRAVVEVYGSMHVDCKVDAPGSDQSFQDYNHYLSNCMTNHLDKLRQDEKDKRLAERVVVDPSDILSAATLVIQFDKSDKRLMRILCCHLAKPNCFEYVDTWEENYLLIENITIRRICDELKKQSLPILKEFLGHSLAVLEDTMLKNNKPYITRRFDGTGINKHREKDMQQFCLLVNASHAATVYAQENGSSIVELTNIIVKKLLECIRNQVPCNWSTQQGHLRGLKVSYIKLNVPKPLATAAAYLYHLPMQPKSFRSCHIKQCVEDPSLCEVEVNIDFAWCRLRALQAFMLEHIRTTNVEDLLADDLGYMELPVENHQVFSFKTCYANSQASNKRMNHLVQSEKDGSIMVHIAILCSSFKSKVLDSLRRKVIESCIKKHQLAVRDYFKLPVNESQEFVQSSELRRLRSPKFGCTEDSYFKLVGNKFYCHLGLLNNISLMKGVTDNEVNVGKVFVEKALCQNMTDQSSVMIFDRDTVYKSQNLADAISFVNVRDVSFHLHDGKLPEFWCDNIKDRHGNAMQANFIVNKSVGDEISNLIQNINLHERNGQASFHPHHRLRKLALKHILKDNLLEDLYQNGTNLSAKLEEKIKENMIYVQNQYVQIQGRPELQTISNLMNSTSTNDECLAKDVYTNSNKLFQMSYAL